MIYILIIPFLFVFISFLTYIKIFYSPYKNQNDIYNIPNEQQYHEKRDYMTSLIDDFNKLTYKDVYIKSYDNLSLHGRYYHVKDNAPIDIAFHGYRGTSTRDFCGGANISFELNHNLLLVDQRAHGNSRGHSLTFGIKEKYDVLSWIKYINKRFGKKTKIVLYGVSMGATTILMSAGLKLPKNVKCIIADSPYMSPKKIINKVCKDMHIPVFLAYPFIFTGAFLFANINIESKKSDASYLLTKSSIPILIIHGKEDRFVPYQMSDIKRNNITRITFDKSGHGLSYIVHKEEYSKLAKAFIVKNMK